MKIIGCIIARTWSKRLPKKVLRDIHGKTMIEHLIDNIKKVPNIDDIYLCTSSHPDDRILLKIADNNGIIGYAGSEQSPIDRMLDVISTEKASHVVRITGDNVFTDAVFLKKMMEEVSKNNKIEYSRTEYLPLGLTAELMESDALKRCYYSLEPEKSEYLMLYMFNPQEYQCQVIIPEAALQAEFSSLTVDTYDDFERTRYIMDHLSDRSGIYYDDVLKLHHQKSIPHFEISQDMIVKLPDGKVSSY
ncbi:cytidylyltransferase domain-containing protein, partial [Methanoculleus sp. MH98A]|uniref:cytidylyltransferase domain-containing protein n=1 Tax=Methanoculleus sp. MH98A TaxID=1495314 RepID=UPI0009E1FBE7